MDYMHAPGNSQSLGDPEPLADPRDRSITRLLRKQLSKSLLEATVDDPAGGEWIIGVVHLHAHAAESDEDDAEDGSRTCCWKSSSRTAAHKPAGI